MRVVDTEAAPRLPDGVAAGSSDPDEPALVRERYARRGSRTADYSLINRSELLMVQERQRAIIDVFVRLGWADLANVRLLEVGCGSGGNLLEFLRLGFRAGASPGNRAPKRPRGGGASGFASSRAHQHR